MESDVIEQMLDTSVKVGVNKAFSRVSVRFITKDCSPVVVVFDMESALKVMENFDDADEVVPRFRPSRLSVKDLFLTAATAIATVVIFNALMGG